MQNITTENLALTKQPDGFYQCAGSTDERIRSVNNMWGVRVVRFTAEAARVAFEGASLEGRYGAIARVIAEEFAKPGATVRTLDVQYDGQPFVLVAYARRHEWTGAVSVLTVATIGEKPDGWSDPMPPTAEEIEVRRRKEEREQQALDARLEWERIVAAKNAAMFENSEAMIPSLILELQVACGIRNGHDFKRVAK